MMGNSLKSSSEARYTETYREIDAQVMAFLSGTIRPDLPLGKLRGMDHILHTIVKWACGEWLEVHIERFPTSCISADGNIPELTFPWQINPGPRDDFNVPGSFKKYPSVRQQCAGCPVAVVAKDVAFPSLTSLPPSTVPYQEEDHLYVNMMPFDIRDRQSLPAYCQQYWPMIERCLKLSLRGGAGTGYLTIDERPVPGGASQRRPGLHVESPGFLPVFSTNAQVISGRYVPGAEHGWGRGLMMRHERVDGGIFMASNVTNTTAVWNCQIRNDDGAFIGSHGDIERFRELLGPCARTLDAGELIWMTDRTPHESLPVPLQPDGTPVRRQYFRLVIGTVTAWYADHSTPNPLGYRPAESVNIVRGNKFTLYPKKCITWSTGDADGISIAYKLRQLHTLLCEHGLGHLYECFQSYGVRSVEALLQKQLASALAAQRELWGAENSESGQPLLHDIDRRGAYYYDFEQIKLLVRHAKALASSSVANPSF